MKLFYNNIFEKTIYLLFFNENLNIIFNPLYVVDVKNKFFLLWGIYV